MGFDSSSLLPLVHTSKYFHASCEAELLAFYAITIETSHSE